MPSCILPLIGKLLDIDVIVNYKKIVIIRENYGIETWIIFPSSYRSYRRLLRSLFLFSHFAWLCIFSIFLLFWVKVYYYLRLFSAFDWVHHLDDYRDESFEWFMKLMIEIRAYELLEVQYFKMLYSGILWPCGWVSKLIWISYLKPAFCFQKSIGTSLLFLTDCSFKFSFPFHQWLNCISYLSVAVVNSLSIARKSAQSSLVFECTMVSQLVSVSLLTLYSCATDVCGCLRVCRVAVGLLFIHY